MYSYTATVTITVNPVNDKHTAGDKTVSTNEDTAAPFTLSGADVDTCDLAFSIVAAPSHGSLGSITNNACVAASPNTDSASVTYTPAANYNGPDSFTYKVTDTGDPAGCGAPGTGCAATMYSYTATVTITVNPVNDKPDRRSTRLNTNHDKTSPSAFSVTNIKTCDLAFSI